MSCDFRRWVFSGGRMPYGMANRVASSALYRCRGLGGRVRFLLGLPVEAGSEDVGFPQASRTRVQGHADPTVRSQEPSPNGKSDLEELTLDGDVAFCRAPRRSHQGREVTELRHLVRGANELEEHLRRNLDIGAGSVAVRWLGWLMEKCASRVSSL